ncbi:hypothetical protein D3P08_03465 [Paenibacillus nanensis]|uniref:Uncharacterized protein n=1 Tax=Paenibacillus nanensis TaxID=393251 RepID=A0A3A1VF92_9BACL|nr:hypothetical protein [Paenibacillus nanensis]RIX59227.1 hypothetical protein D3P08_03465 [Paenibacillus nanensis]
MKIMEVTTEGFRFIDKDGKHTVVDFKQCNENWIRYQKTRNRWSDEEAQEFRKKSNCIGQRDICAKPCYFTFFTEPYTKIEFNGLRAKKKFRHFQMKIIEAGWTTFDLS